MKTEILNKLKTMAKDRTIPFCMSCYVKAPKGICPCCHTDDLARWMDGVGLDWNLDFAIQYIIQEEFTPIDLDEVFEDLMLTCYPKKTQVGWMSFDTIDLMKSQDPISWRIARDEYFYGLETDGEIVTFDNDSIYYWKNDVESLSE